MGDKQSAAPLELVQVVAGRRYYNHGAPLELGQVAKHRTLARALNGWVGGQGAVSLRWSLSRCFGGAPGYNHGAPLELGPERDRRAK
jgi:hypothetical protein